MTPEYGDTHNPMIGVGAGGSCPSCRAPVDLGQEFCLECGSPIRFSKKLEAEQKPTRGMDHRATPYAHIPPPPRGFPWLPFVLVLLLVAGGLAFALVDRGDSGPSKGNKPEITTESALPQITNSLPDRDGDVGHTETLQDCDPNTMNGSSSDDEFLPRIEPREGALDDGSSDPFSTDSAKALDPEVVYVDQYGEPCGDLVSADDGTDDEDDEGELLDDSDGLMIDPVDPDSNVGVDDETNDSSSKPNSSSKPGTSTRPSGSPKPATSTGAEEGWTVIVFGFPDEKRANQRAADLQEKGYESGVIFSSDYGSLCPGFYVVYSGIFSNKKDAQAQEKKLRGTYQGMYIRELRKNGSASGCAT